MNTKKIEQLKIEKRDLQHKISNIEREIYLLQQECAHQELNASEPRTLEPRWAYDMAYSYDSTGERVIETRNVNCTCCGTSWAEMRYTDADWLESNKWAEKARTGN